MFLRLMCNLNAADLGKGAAMSLSDVKVITPKRFGDDRGFFSETWNKARLSQDGIEIDFVQDNHSMSHAVGTLRGLHFQSPPHAQAKLVRCGRGRLFDVADQWGGPTPARAIAEACHQIATAKAQGTAHGSGIYQFAGAPDTNWADFARAIFDIAGFGPTVTDIPTSAYPTPARRPLNSRMDCSTVLSDFGIARPEWRDHLTQVIAEVTQSQG